jgi:trehalose/maltose hydrolase-like predicted phosphorylase
MAGPAVVEQALRSNVRETTLAGIVAAPACEDRAELLVALAKVAGGGDRRTAIPAARAARTIAEQLAKKELADDIAAGDIQAWRDAYEHGQIKVSGDREIQQLLAKVIERQVARAHLKRAH